MNKLIEYPLEHGGSVLVETMEPSFDAVRGPRAEQAIEKVAQTFDAAVASVRPVVDAALRQLSALASKPESVELEFALKFTAAAGAVIAATGAEAALRFKLTWKPPRTQG